MVTFREGGVFGEDSVGSFGVIKFRNFEVLDEKIFILIYSFPYIFAPEDFFIYLVVQDIVGKEV